MSLEKNSYVKEKKKRKIRRRWQKMNYKKEGQSEM